MAGIIDEDSDSSEEFIISSPNKCLHDLIPIIEDSSSPIKITQDIVESHTPEAKKRKSFDFIRKRSLNRSNKSTNIKRNVSETRPSLSFTISKKNKLFTFGHAQAPEQTSTVSSPQLTFHVKKRHNPTIDESLETVNSPGPSRNPTSLPIDSKLCPTQLKFMEVSSYSDSSNDKEGHVPELTTSTSSQLSCLIKTRHKPAKQKERKKIVSEGLHINPSSLDVCSLRSAEKDNSCSIIQQLSKDNKFELGQIDFSQDTITDVESQPLQIYDDSQEVEMFNLEPIKSPTIEDASTKNLSECLDKIKEPCHKEKYVTEVISKNIRHHDESFKPISKIPKRGSLLEKAYKVILSKKRDSALFSHEINVGLRTSRGSYASDVLIVKSIYSEDNYFLIECNPPVNNFGSLEETDGVQPMTLDPLKMFLYTLEIPKGVKVGCKFVVHFPVLILFDVYQKRIIVFIENRIQIVHQLFPSPSFLKSNMKVNTASNKESLKIFRTLKSRTSKNVLDAVVGNLLISESVLELSVLHIYNRQKNEVIFLALDSEQQFSIIHFTNSGKIEDIGHIQIDAVYIFVGFYLKKCFDFSGEIKDVAEYYNCGHVSNKYMYVFESYLLNSKINFVKKLDPIIRPSSSFSTLLHETMDEKRVKIFVRVIRYIEEKIFVGENKDLDYIELHTQLSNIEKNFPLPPFVLEGVYLKNRVLCFDRYSRLES